MYNYFLSTAPNEVSWSLLKPVKYIESVIKGMEIKL